MDVLEGLNEKQYEAVSSTYRHLRIIAGAGSGKTRTLSEKVFTIIDKGEVKPSELLVLTFTDNAAHEMRQRIISTFKERGQDDVAEQVASAHIQTFDSFALDIVKKYHHLIGLPSDIKIVSEAIIKLQKSKIYPRCAFMG